MGKETVDPIQILTAAITLQTLLFPPLYTAGFSSLPRSNYVPLLFQSYLI